MNIQYAHDSDPGAAFNGQNFLTTAEARRVALLSLQKPMPPIAADHLRDYPFKAPANVQESTLWYEGTFDPLGPHHLEIFSRTMIELGFNRAVLAIVFQNPYKKDALSYEHRYNMAKLAIESVGLTVTDDPQKEGVCIFTNEVAFHHRRLITLYDRNSYVLIGPDNFEKAIQNNVLWVHPPEIRENPSASDSFGFRSLCERVKGFRGRVLVYPQHFEIHSTDIREGRVPAIPSVEQYANSHGLYKPSEASKTQAVRPIQTVDRKSVLSTEEALERAELTRNLSARLGELNLFSSSVSEALNAAIGQLDRSEIAELNRELSLLAVPQTKETQQAVDVESRFQKPLSSLRRLREAVLNAIVGKDLKVTGSEHVLEAVRGGHQVLFVGNRAAWGDPALFSYALKSEGLAAVSDKLPFVSRDDAYPSPFARLFFGRSLSQITIPSAFDERFAVIAEDTAERNAMLHGIKRLGKDGVLAVFPERAGSLSVGMSPFQSQWLEILTSNNLEEQGIDSEKLVIIPWSQLGNSVLHNGKGVSFSEDVPPVVSIGPAISYRTLKDIAVKESPEVAAHVVGFLVASMLNPEDMRVYSPYTASYIGSTDPRVALSEADIRHIETARAYAAQLIARSRPGNA